MNRGEMLTIVKELYDVLNSKNVSPNEAKSIADIFQRSVCRNNEEGIEEYLKTGIFTGGPPES